MKLSLPTSELLARLQAVTRVSSTRTSLHAPSGIMLTAAEASLLLMATDLDLALQLSVAANVETSGSALLPGRLLFDVVRALPGQTVSIEARPTDGDVEIISAASTFHLRTLRAEDFPQLPTPHSTGRTTIPAQVFTQTVDTVVRSASRDDTRPVLTGILVSAAASELTMVATDSYRLSVKRTPLPTALEGSVEANIPARALQELSRLTSSAASETITFGVQDGQVVFELDGAILSSRLIDGQFPNYRQLLPTTAEHELRLSTQELSGVVRRISLLAQKNAPLRLRFSSGELAVSAQTVDVGEAHESLPVPFDGEPFEIGFNPEFLRDGLESIASEEFVLKLISPLRPGLIESPDTADFIYLIMPIRLTA